MSSGVHISTGSILNVICGLLNVPAYLCSAKYFVSSPVVQYICTTTGYDLKSPVLTYSSTHEFIVIHVKLLVQLLSINLNQDDQIYHVIVDTVGDKSVLIL